MASKEEGDETPQLMPVRSHIRSQSIRNATDQVVKAAEKMERSDSILVTDEDDDEIEEEEHDQTYEEDPSVEALLSASSQATHLVHLSHVRRVSSITSRRRMSSEASRASLNSTDFEVDRFQALEESLHLESFNDDASPTPLDESTTPKTVVEILQSCESLPLSVSQLYSLHQRGLTDAEIATALLQAREKKQQQVDSAPRDKKQQKTEKTHATQLNSHPSVNNEEALLLHSLFGTFCTPPPSLDSVTKILKLERTKDYGQSVALPRDALVAVAGNQKSCLISLLTCPHFVQLPLHFQLALMRILIRLLTNETDAEYNNGCLFTCEWAREDAPEEKRRQSLSTAKRLNQLYTVVRFRSGSAWTKCAVTSFLELFSIFNKQEDSLMMAPIARMVGLCASAGVSVKDLHRILSLASGPSENGLDRLLMIRALTTAAEGASQSSMLVGKASPRFFFNFGLGHGLARIFKPLPVWPFRNDFGMAVWFRAESLEFTTSPGMYPKLLSIRTHDGGGMEVSLVPLKLKSKTPPATVICVSIFDSGGALSEQVKLERCILLPRVWYHVAIRHTRSRLKGVFSMSSRQQVSIMLDGKLLKTESLKFPKISIGDTAGESPANMLRKSLLRSSDQQSGSTMTIQCGANFEGQTGAFYIFNDSVSDATLRALYEVTGGTNGVIKTRSGDAASWDERRGDIAHRSRALGVDIVHADAEEIVLSSNESGSAAVMNAAMVADLEDTDDSDVPSELSRLSLGSRLFLVWDPRRVEDPTALELHSGAHVRIDADKLQPWHVDGAKNVIASIGGVQALVPIFRAALSGEVERHWAQRQNSKDNDGPTRLSNERVSTMIPCLLSLLASFLRDHGGNAREILRCGGVDIIEQLILANKAFSKSDGELQGKETLMSVLTINQGLSKLLVASLLDLRAASSHYTGLEAAVLSRLFFNLQLWFGGSVPTHGVTLHACLFPVLSSLAHRSPRKVRDCVGVRRMIELLREYTNGNDKKVSAQEATTNLFDRSPASSLDRRDPLTIGERRHLTDVIFSMITSLLRSGSPPFQLQPLLNYISHNVDVEWELASKEMKDAADQVVRTGMRMERYLATVKAATVLRCLLQARPVVPHLTDSLALCCGGELGASGWILCCLVNTFDDELRAVGIICLSAYLSQIAPAEDALLTAEVSGHPSNANDHTAECPQYKPLTSTGVLAPNRFASTFTNVGKGLAAIGNSASLSRIMPTSKVSVTVVYKLLWHLLKCHRERSAKFTHAALLQILLDDGELVHSSVLSMDEFVVRDEILRGGFKINLVAGDASALSLGSCSDESLRQTPAINTVFRLLRFLPSLWKEKWLHEFVEMSSASSSNVEILLSSSQWQPPLFHLVSDIVEELGTISASSKSVANGDEAHHDRIKSSFDLSFRLYANLLGHCSRHGGEQASQMLEQAASLQRTCINGHEVFTLILSHLLADLNGFGMVDTAVGHASAGEGSKLLRQSARIVTNAIMSNGSDGFDTTAAVKQWRCLRHLTAVTTAAVTKSGFSVADLFDYRNQHGSSLDDLSGGIHGIRLSESDVVGMKAEEFVSLLSLSSKSKSDQPERDFHRQVCVALSAQVLSLLDAFIFPASLDASLPAIQLHGLALVRSNEPRLGVSQGPILASVVRLSLVLTCHLEPSSVKFLQCCYRLRCFVQWMLELIRESVSLAGYSAAFDELTAPLDRLILAIVLQCHRGLARCSAVLTVLETSPFEAYFPNEDAQKKDCKRVLRSALELREIVLAAYRGRNEVIKAALSPKAFDALQAGLETNPSGSKESVIRSFLSNAWVSNFQDVDIRGDLAIPAQITEDQERSSPNAGVKAIEALARESDAILSDYNRALDIQFEAYCEDQRKWAETDAVRDLEYEGDGVVQRLSNKLLVDLSESAKRMSVRAESSRARMCSIDRNAVELWKSAAHWKVADHTDMLNRRILLIRNRDFDDHHDASYELMLTKEREKAIKDREERERRKQEEELSELVGRNPSAFVPYGDIEDFDDEENLEDIDEVDYEKQSDGGDVDTDEKSMHSNNTEPVVEEGDGSPSGADGQEEVMEENEQEPDESNGMLDGDAWAKTFIWSSAESVVARFENVSIVSLQTITEGRLLLTTHGLYFNRTGAVVSVMTKQHVEEGKASLEPSSLRWRLGRLTEVHGRRFMLRAQALELFFSDSHELFVNFGNGTRERDRFHAKLRNSCKVPLLWSTKSLNPRTAFKKSQLTQLWRKRKISNFQYLMQLNKMAGRTFNDITQYPVFPWVIADYTSDELDLDDYRAYRDLSKPVGALNPDRLSQLIERYNELESFGFSENERFLYGSHYSSPGIVLHFMLRQEPFTTMAIELQSGRFDCPDRLFFDVAGCWNSCMTSTSDVKELIPELFTCPEIFLNTNNFPLGSTQDGRNIDNVALPPWAKGSAHEFVRLQRLALESEYVSKNLHHWIDLIFGYKQRGPEAESAHNIFHYLSYEGAVDLDKIADEVDRTAAESHIQNFGQTPCQLLVKEPHPTRYSLSDSWQPLLTNSIVPKQLRCHKPQKQFGGKHGGVARGAVMCIHVMTETLLVVHGDMSLASYKWHPNRSGSKRPFSFKKDKHKPLARRDLSTSRASIKRSSATPPSMESSDSRYAVGNWSFGVTVGGQVKENLRRKAVLAQSRLSVPVVDRSAAEASTLLISCGYWDDTVKIHPMDGSRVLCSVNGGHRGPIRCLAIGNDGGLMVTGGDDGTCRIWLVDHPDMAMALSDGYVQTALGTSISRDELLSCCHVLWGHETPVTCVALSSDLDVTVSGSVGGKICVHTVRRGSFVRSIQLAGRNKNKSSPLAVRKIVLDSHGTFVAHTEDDFLHAYTVNGVHLCSADAKEQLHDMKINGELLLTGGDKGHVVVRTVCNLQVLSMLDLSRHGPIRCISLTPEELNPVPQFLFIGSDDGLITIVDKDPLFSSKPK